MNIKVDSREASRGLNTLSKNLTSIEKTGKKSSTSLSRLEKSFIKIEKSITSASKPIIKMQKSLDKLAGGKIQGLICLHGSVLKNNTRRYLSNKQGYPTSHNYCNVREHKASSHAFQRTTSLREKRAS